MDILKNSNKTFENFKKYSKPIWKILKFKKKFFYLQQTSYHEPQWLDEENYL